ncbi:MAG TPA: 4'-phosphopantetheinyl transferase superfamily protein [Polyangiaceae bacterium]|jgi:4'-phosphopantetheinyl transferase
MRGRELTSHQLDVWLVDSGRLREPARLAAYLTLLSIDEGERFERIVHDETRHEFLVARALVRRTLSLYCENMAPADWRFENNAFGRPEIAAGQIELDLRFNLSHAHGLVACAVALGRTVGIDVEWNQREPSMLSSIQHFFSPTEVRDLLALPEPARPARFFQVWTLKEAYIKAHGKGLSMPLADFSFRFDGPDGHARLEPAPGDSADRWRVWTWNPSDEHNLALLAEFAPDEPVELRVENITP